MEIIGLGFLAVAERGKGEASDALRRELRKRGVLPAEKPKSTLFCEGDGASPRSATSRITWQHDNGGYHGTGWRFPDGKLAELRRAYPTLNLDQELAHADQWLKTPGNRKKDHHRFLVTTWLGRALDRPRRGRSGGMLSVAGALGPFKTFRELHEAVLENAPCTIWVNQIQHEISTELAKDLRWNNKEGLVYASRPGVEVKRSELPVTTVVPIQG